MKIYSRYDTPDVPGVKIESPSLTQQQFKDESDINYIIDRYQTTGCLTDPFVKPTRLPMYGDYTQVPDFLTANNIMLQAEEDFMKLPSNIRKEFQNNPNEFLQFMTNPDNYEKAFELGLVEKKPEQLPKVEVNNAEVNA